MKLNSFKKVQAFVAKAICGRLIYIQDTEIISDETFEKLFQFVDINHIPDTAILNDSRFKNRINWDLIEKFKLIRLLARDISILKQVDIKKRNYKLMEIYPLLLIYPELINYFDIKFDTLTWFEAIKVLECNNNLIDKINLSKYQPNKSQSLEVIKKFYNNEKILKQIDLKNLDDHFIIRKLLISTGNKYINNLNLNVLKASDWVDILETRPELLEHCNLLLFEVNDCYLLIKLISLFPHLDYLIEENKDKISGLGWEQLIIKDYEKYESICCWEKLSKKNWENIVLQHPDLENIKRKYVF